MRTPTDVEREELIHLYDPAKAHEYYLRVRKLKGRQPGSGNQPTGFAKANAQRHESAKAKQKQELQARVTNLSKKLLELEKLIQIKEAAAKRSKATANANSKAKGDKPQTAADKAKASRESKKYRKKHKQELKTKAKQASKSGGGSSKKTAANPRKASISELKSLATKVRGQIAVAKQKLAAL